MAGFGRHRGPLLFVAATLAAALAAYFGGYWLGQRPASGAAHSAPVDAPAPASSSPEPSAAPSATPATPSPTPATRAAGAVPASGSGQFGIAGGTGGRVGSTGRFVRYQIAVEYEAGVAATDFAAAVEAILADPRGWTAAGRWSFQRVSTGPADATIHLATPATTDRICGRHGIRTLGEVSCRGGRDVVINLKRWELAVPWYADARDDYRRMVVNHEVGHFLGHGHVTCPGAGRSAPVMQRQTFGLEGCARNAWPYPDGRTFVSGPTAPR